MARAEERSASRRRWRIDPTAREFERFVTESTDGLYRSAFLMTWDGGECEDLVQETFLKVARRWSKIRTMDHPYAYARRVLVNLVLDGSARRSRSRQELELLDDTGPAIDPHARIALEQVDDADAIGRALAALTARQRLVLILRYFEDLPEAEVATLLGCSVGTVKSTASRAASRLAAEVDHEPFPDITVLTPATRGAVS
jgi:RNA polymerase sigma-70 factor (sigma-E family)